VIANVASLEALNDYEVKFTLKAAQASFLTKALERASGRAMMIVSRGALGSGLIAFQSHYVTVAASALAKNNTFGHRS